MRKGVEKQFLIKENGVLYREKLSYLEELEDRTLVENLVHTFELTFKALIC